MTATPINAFRSLPPSELITIEIRTVADSLRRTACDGPRDLRDARRALRVTSFLETAPGHRRLLLTHLASETIDRADDQAINFIVAGWRGMPPARAWQHYQFADDELWRAAAEVAGSAEDVTLPGRDTLRTLTESARKWVNREPLT